MGGHEKLHLKNGGVIKIIRGKIEAPLKSFGTDANILRPPIMSDCSLMIRNIQCRKWHEIV